MSLSQYSMCHQDQQRSCWNMTASDWRWHSVRALEGVGAFLDYQQKAKSDPQVR
jgi:hypothetical protein